jgi:hypothetical protein
MSSFAARSIGSRMVFAQPCKIRERIVKLAGIVEEEVGDWIGHEDFAQPGQALTHLRKRFPQVSLQAIGAPGSPPACPTRKL